jgi:hypothetical protein
MRSQIDEAILRDVFSCGTVTSIAERRDGMSSLDQGAREGEHGSGVPRLGYDVHLLEAVAIGSQGYVPGAQKPAFGVSSPRIGVAAMFLSVNKRRDAI